MYENELTSLQALTSSGVSVNLTDRFWIAEDESLLLPASVETYAFELLDSAPDNLSIRVPSFHINSIAKESPDLKLFASTKSFQPFPKLILPFLSRWIFVSHFLPSLPNRYIILSLFKLFSLANCAGTTWKKIEGRIHIRNTKSAREKTNPLKQETVW